MKRTLVCALLAAGCGDDGAATPDGGDSGGSSSHGTTHGDASTSDSASATTDMTDTTDGLGTSSSAGEITTLDGSSSSAGETSGATSSATDGSTSTGGTADGCLAPEIFAVLDQHAHDLAATAGLLATHPSADEVTGFMLAPALPAPPALAGSFAGPLIMTCSDPFLYDEYCEEGRCSQLECTGEGSAWINHLWIEPAVMNDPWSFEEVHIHLRWSGGSGTAIDIETISSGPDGVDMSMTAVGEMDVNGMSITETFPALHPAGATELQYADGPGGYAGQLTIADVVVAEVDADDGHLEWTGDCP